MKKLTILFMMTLMVLCLTACSSDDGDSGPEQINASFGTTTIATSETAGTVTSTITLPEGAKTEATVVTFTIGGTAVQGTDYTISSNGSLTIPANATSADITLTILDNILQDGERTIEMTITGISVGGVAAQLSGTAKTVSITIADDECSPYIAGTWNFEATYFSVFGTDNIPVGQNGQGLVSETDEEGNPNPDWTPGTPSIENPEFVGTIEITDANGSREYTISDVIIKQFGGLEAVGDTPSLLIDNCGDLSVPTGEDTPLVAGAFPATFTGTINEDGTISASWEYSLPDGSALVGFGSATFTKAE